MGCAPAADDNAREGALTAARRMSSSATLLDGVEGDESEP